MSDIHEIKIGFIGFGNMAQAMAAGLLRGGQTPAGQIFACARDWDKLCRNTQPFGMVPVHTADELVRQADVVVLAVKPYQISDVVLSLIHILKFVCQLTKKYGVKTTVSMNPIMIDGTGTVSYTHLDVYKRQV